MLVGKKIMRQHDNRKKWKISWNWPSSRKESQKPDKPGMFKPKARLARLGCSQMLTI
jgi:hypothetical protein